MSNPYLRITGNEPVKFRIVGLPAKVYRRSVRDETGAMRFLLCDPPLENYIENPAFARYALKVIDRSDNQVKIIELPVSPMKQIQRHRELIQQRRQKHGRKTPYDLGGMTYGAEVTVVRVGERMFTRYIVSAEMKRVLKAERELLKQQPLDLEKILADQLKRDTALAAGTNAPHCL